VSLSGLKHWIKDQGQLVDMNPEFQRKHRWTIEKRIAYMEFLLRGGQSSRNIYWNHPSYMGETTQSELAKELVLVDGKQRMTTCLMFLDDEIPVFGHVLSEYTDEIDRRCAVGMGGVTLIMCVNNLQTQADVLQWYLDINTGGVVHTDEEISFVQELLKAEKARRG
jgi:hypothetical protein